MRSATARKGTRHAARSGSVLRSRPGKWDETIHKHTHPAPGKANPTLPHRRAPGQAAHRSRSGLGWGAGSVPSAGGGVLGGRGGRRGRRGRGAGLRRRAAGPRRGRPGPGDRARGRQGGHVGPGQRVGGVCEGRPASPAPASSAPSPDARSASDRSASGSGGRGGAARAVRPWPRGPLARPVGEYGTAIGPRRAPSGGPLLPSPPGRLRVVRLGDAHAARQRHGGEYHGRGHGTRCAGREEHRRTFRA